jgi:hypothetical protein
MSRTVGRTEYCRRQAAECAAAAAATAIFDVKEAYLNLEQGWLKLAPEAEGAYTDAARARGRLPAAPTVQAE